MKSITEMSEFRDTNGNLVYIKVNPYTKEEVKDPVECQQYQQGFANYYIESWAFVTREYKSDGGGVKHTLSKVNHFDTEGKAIKYLYSNEWEDDFKGGFRRSKPTDGWSASEYARITCEKIKLIH